MDWFYMVYGDGMTEIGAAISRICMDLGLPSGDKYTQDWAYEVGPEYRGEAALSRYLDAYVGYGDTERAVLAELILDVANDLMISNEAAGVAAWPKVERILRSDANLLRELITYWAVFDASVEDAFALSPLVRKLWVNLYPPGKD